VWTGVTEYEISRRITTRVVGMLHTAGAPCSIIDVGGLCPDEPYGWIKQEKCKRVNAIAKEHSEAIAIELHLQSASGVAVLHWHRSTDGLVIAHSLQDHLEQGINNGRHWHGVIHCPNPTYWPEAPRYCPFFIQDTAPTALIVELGSIKRGKWWYNNVESVAAVVSNALQGAAG